MNVQLSDSQKKIIIDKIELGEIDDIYSFLSIYSSIVKTSNTIPIFTLELNNFATKEEDRYKYSKGEEISAVSESMYKSVEDFLTGFLLLCDNLEFKVGAIRSFQLPKNGRKFIPVFAIKPDKTINNEPRFIYSKLNQIIYERYRWVFVPKPELIEYIANGYLTSYEIDRDNETKRKKKELFWTRFGGISVIVLSLATAVFNYITYDKKREVEIKNLNAFPESTKVYLSTQNKTVPDTIKIYDTIKINR